MDWLAVDLALMLISAQSAFANDPYALFSKPSSIIVFLDTDNL